SSDVGGSGSLAEWCAWSYVLCYLLVVSVFFFSSRRRHTRLVSDWSSDVCSSDLRSRTRGPAGQRVRDRDGGGGDAVARWAGDLQIGRASCRGRGGMSGGGGEWKRTKVRKEGDGGRTVEGRMGQREWKADGVGGGV